MKKLKWILVVLSVVVVVVISIKIENQFKVCDRIGTIFSFDKNDCDDLDLKNSKNDVVMAQRAGGSSISTSLRMSIITSWSIRGVCRMQIPLCRHVSKSRKVKRMFTRTG